MRIQRRMAEWFPLCASALLCNRNFPGPGATIEAAMHYREFLPNRSLQPFVKCLWTLRHDYSQSSHSEEQLPPRGEINLIFHYGKPFALHDGKQWVQQPASFLIGQQERFFVLRSLGLTGLVAARFHPWGAYPFLSVPASELTGQFVAMEAVFGARGGELVECLANAPSPENAVTILENFLSLRLRDFDQDLRPVRSVIRQIIAERGQLAMGGLLQDQSLSPRQMERRFNEVVGIPPKRLARIIRFQFTLQSIYSNPFRHLTGVAYDHGYADQSHCISDFKILLGKTPSMVQREALQGLPADFDVEFLQSPADGFA